MQRRNFIKTTGLSVTSLLLSDFLIAGGGNHISMQMPDAVSILNDDTYNFLSVKGQNKWMYKDVLVTIKKMDDVTRILVESPSTPLKEVKLSWKYPANKMAAILGDAWERTYGNESWKPFDTTGKLPWYCIINDNNDAACFGVRTGCNSICSWQLASGILHLTLDTRNGGKGVVLGTRELHCCDIVTTKNLVNENVYATARRFCAQMCSKPRLTAQPVYGINDWYFAYGNNSANLIKDTTALMATLATNADNLPFSVIDAGWAVKSPLLPDDCCWGDDFTVSNSKFGDMSLLAKDIKNTGMRPGLWTRPLTAKHDDKSNLLLPMITGRNDSKTPILDPTIPENTERIKNLFITYKQWGFEMVKHDFTTFDFFGRWGFDMEQNLTQPGWQCNDTTRTNAEIILHLYRSIREAAGDMYIIGCNTMSHLAAGIFELNRIGDDTSGKEWSRTRKMGVNTLGFRMMQHKTFYEADGDCVGLTNDIPWDKNKQWMDLLARSSAPLFISAAPDATGEVQKKFIKECFARASKQQTVAEPLDWLTNNLPCRWMLDNQEVNFNWS